MKVISLAIFCFLIIIGTVQSGFTQGPSRHVGSIPVYDKFDDLAPRLGFQNDTTYVINLWATWCKPCVQELPYFEQLQQAYRNQKVKIILVSLDFSRQLESKLLPFVQDKQLKPEVIALIDSDYNAWIDRISPEWSGAIPVTIVRKGNQKKVIMEELPNYETLDQMVKTFVNQ
jgi:thiol-disulfide isomerase/thioredoxin